jgi:hypothetical protein
LLFLVNSAKAKQITTCFVGKRQIAEYPNEKMAANNI